MIISLELTIIFFLSLFIVNISLTPSIRNWWYDCKWIHPFIHWKSLIWWWWWWEWFNLFKWLVIIDHYYGGQGTKKLFERIFFVSHQNPHQWYRITDYSNYNHDTIYHFGCLSVAFVCAPKIRLKYLLLLMLLFLVKIHWLILTQIDNQLITVKATNIWH